MMPRCSLAGLGPRIIPAGLDALLEFLTGFTHWGERCLAIEGGVKERGLNLEPLGLNGSTELADVSSRRQALAFSPRNRKVHFMRVS
jgi:hypothetical protein